MMTRREIAMHKAYIACYLAAWLSDLYELQSELGPNSVLEKGIDDAIVNTLEELAKIPSTTFE